MARDQAAVLAFARRDRTAVSRATAAYWVSWKRRRGAAAAIALGDQLRTQVLARRPRWPSRADRLADLRNHLRVSEALRRVRPR